MPQKERCGCKGPRGTHNVSLPLLWDWGTEASEIGWEMYPEYR